MTNTSAGVSSPDGLWVRFWHAPVRAERLGLMRIMLATALLADELIQYLPGLSLYFGPEGFSPAVLGGEYQLRTWRLTYLLFHTDNLTVVYAVYWMWVAATVGFLVGWQTRWMNILLWLLTRCIHERNPALLYGGDSVLRVALFLLILTPSGAALSLDASRRRRHGLLEGPSWIKPWSLRLLQIQLCLIYFATGLAKLKGENWGDGFWTSWPNGFSLGEALPRFGQWLTNPAREWPKGSWWDGTAIYYFLNDTTMSRWAYAQFPIPYWITVPMTYVTVCWEVLFPLLMLNRWTRRCTLVMGVMFHLGIALTVDIGWFSYYSLSFYALWTPHWFWQRFDRAPSAQTPPMAGQLAKALV